MISTEVSSRLKSYDFQVFNHTFQDKTVLVFVKVYNELVYISCGEEYPLHIAEKFLCEVRNTNDIDNLLKDYQNPQAHDTLDKIQKSLKETKEISIKALNSLLERNEKLEDLAAKSEQLSITSKIFYNESHKRNKCC